MCKVEVWKPVVGYEGAYEVSSEGRCRRAVNRFGNPSGRLLKPSIGRGYPRYALSYDDQVRHLSAHRLMWEAFVGPIPEGMQINHKNGVKSDNRLENLEVVTPSENTQHAHNVLGYVPKKPPHVPGTKNGRALVTEEQVREIRSRYKTGETQDSLAAAFGVKQTTISQIVLGKIWRHVV